MSQDIPKMMTDDPKFNAFYLRDAVIYAREKGLNYIQLSPELALVIADQLDGKPT